MNKKLAILFVLLFDMTILFANEIETISKTEGVLSSKQLFYFKELFGLNSFIETGTYRGDTTEEASKVFDEVHSIEIYEPNFTRAQKRFAQYPNVTLYYGDTITELHRMIDGSLAKRLYWLDAHSSGGGTGGIPGFSPILDELDQILRFKGDIDSVILIDDLRGMCHCDKRANLPLRLIIHKIKEISPDLEFYSIGDIGIIFNKRSCPLITPTEIVKNASISRFFDQDCEDEEMLEKLIDAESFIASINEKTKEGDVFCQLKSWVNKNELGGEVIYLLWESLRELKKDELPSAINDLQLVANSFYSHWRIDAYLVKALLLDGQVDKAVTIFDKRLSQVYKNHPRIIEKIIDVDLIQSRL